MYNLLIHNKLISWLCLFSRDLRMHKLVFQNDVLPDGTELAYYARGQVAITLCTFILLFLF